MERNRNLGEKQAHFGADPTDDALFEKWGIWGKLPVRTSLPQLFTVKAIMDLLNKYVFTSCQVLLRVGCMVMKPTDMLPPLTELPAGQEDTIT